MGLPRAGKTVPTAHLTLAADIAIISFLVSPVGWDGERPPASGSTAPFA
jgi:hypothetical protein